MNDCSEPPSQNQAPPRGRKEHAFGKIPTAVAQSGVLATLRKGELLVYVIIAAHVNGRTHESRPTVKTIAKETKLHHRTVEKAIQELVKKRLLTVAIGGGRGKANTYTLTTIPGFLEAGVSKPPNSSEPTERPRPNLTETLALAPGNPGRENTIPRPPEAAPTEEQMEQQNSSAATADRIESEVDPLVLNALAGAGIGDPKRTELARWWSGIPGAAGFIGDIAEQLRSHGKGTGAIVLELEARADQERERILKYQAFNQAEKKRLAEIAAEDEQILRERDEQDAIIASLSDDERNQLENMAREQADHWQRQNWIGKSVYDSTPLWVAVVKLARDAERSTGMPEACQTGTDPG